MSIYNVTVRLDETLPDGSVVQLVLEQRSAIKSSAVRSALRTATDAADCTWRKHSWDEEKRVKRQS